MQAIYMSTPGENGWASYKVAEGSRTMRPGGWASTASSRIWMWCWAARSRRRSGLGGRFHDMITGCLVKNGGISNVIDIRSARRRVLPVYLRRSRFSRSVFARSLRRKLEPTHALSLSLACDERSIGPGSLYALASYVLRLVCRAVAGGGYKSQRAEGRCLS